MRYDVRRSKVHMINKLSRQAKLLKNKKGTEEQVGKNKYKAERLIKEISLIKQIKNDEVSRLALITAVEELQKIQNDTKLLLVTRSMAKLAMHKFIVASVDEFRRKHPDWQQLLPSLLEKQKKTKQVKVDKSSEAVVNNSHKSTVSTKENLDGSDTNNPLEMEHDSNSGNYSKQENNNKKKNVCKKKIKKEKFSSDSGDEVNDKHCRPTIEQNSEESDVQNENKGSGEMKVVDPFFMTIENTEYITSQVPTLEKSSNVTDSIQNRKFGSNNIRLQDKNVSKENWKHFKSKNSLFNQSYKNDTIPSNSFNSNTRALNSKARSSGGTHHERSAHQSSDNDKLKQEKLHPSWEAKKKLSSIAKFEGKKITFDDD